MSRPPAIAFRMLGGVLLGAALLAAHLATTPATGMPGCPDMSGRIDVFSLMAPSLGHSARISVYVPPGYDCDRSRRYPVFYFNDGQQVFGWRSPTSGISPEVAAQIIVQSEGYGSWRVDEQFAQAAADGLLPPMIAVGISSDSGPRSRNLAPVPWAGSIEARGVQYGEFVARGVVPVIDSRYRTRTNRACRGIAGSSLGGASALQIGLAHPREFSLVIALSPVIGDPAIAAYLAERWRSPHFDLPTSILVDFDDDPVGNADRVWLSDFLSTIGRTPHTPTILQTTGGSHTIESWAERVVPALESVLDGRCGD